MEGDIGQRVLPRLPARLCDAQIVLPKELRIRQPREQHLLVPGQNGRAVIGRFAVGHCNEPLDLSRFGIANREELLMFFHARLQHLGGEVQKRLVDPAHQHDRPLNQSRNLGQKRRVLGHLQPGGEGLIGSILPDRASTLPGIQHDMGRFQPGRVILEPGDGKPPRRHETVPFGRVSRADAVHIQIDHLRLAQIIGKDAQDGMQRAHPAQSAGAPAH